MFSDTISEVSTTGSVQTKKRRIVFHECYMFDESILDILRPNDLLFFDDCLYSQYIFIKNHNDFFIENNIQCILGFSTSLHRPNDTKPFYSCTSSKVHVEVHKCFNNDVGCLRKELVVLPFMSLEEIKELLSYPNIFLACHGSMHTQLWKYSGIETQYTYFILDTKTAIDDLNRYNLKTDIYVYPYTYVFDIDRTDRYLNKVGYKYTFAGRDGTHRVSIENLLNGKIEFKD